MCKNCDQEHEMINKHTAGVLPILTALINSGNSAQWVIGTDKGDEILINRAVELYNKLWERVASEYSA